MGMGHSVLEMGNPKIQNFYCMANSAAIPSKIGDAELGTPELDETEVGTPK